MVISRSLAFRITDEDTLTMQRRIPEGGINPLHMQGLWELLPIEEHPADPIHGEYPRVKQSLDCVRKMEIRFGKLLLLTVPSS